MYLYLLVIILLIIIAALFKMGKLGGVEPKLNNIVFDLLLGKLRSSDRDCDTFIDYINGSEWPSLQSEDEYEGTVVLADKELIKTLNSEYLRKLSRNFTMIIFVNPGESEEFYNVQPYIDYIKKCDPTVATDFANEGELDEAKTLLAKLVEKVGIIIDEMSKLRISADNMSYNDIELLIRPFMNIRDTFTRVTKNESD